MGAYADVDIKRVVIDETTAATNIIIASVAGKFILVLEYNLVISADSIMQWFTGIPPVQARSGPMPMGANQVHYVTFAPEGHFLSTLAGPIDLKSSAIVNQGGWVRYVELP